jgi:hypothetical protein
MGYLSRIFGELATELRLDALIVVKIHSFFEVPL